MTRCIYDTYRHWLQPLFNKPLAVSGAPRPGMPCYLYVNFLRTIWGRSAFLRIRFIQYCIAAVIASSCHGKCAQCLEMCSWCTSKRQRQRATQFFIERYTLRHVQICLALRLRWYSIFPLLCCIFQTDFVCLLACHHSSYLPHFLFKWLF